MTYRIITCRCCGKVGRYAANNWIQSCYQRWTRAGRPNTGPAPARRPKRGPGRAPRTRPHQVRLENYADLRSWGVAKKEAAARLGVSVDTIRTYERELRTADIGEAE